MNEPIDCESGLISLDVLSTAAIDLVVGPDVTSVLVFDGNCRAWDHI